MKYLIVNGDDFGASHGINRGIIEAHQRGILTSTSLLVNTPWSEEAAEFANGMPDVSVGLHADLREVLQPARAQTGQQRPYEELQKQFSRFEKLMHGRPTHLDAHHNLHRDRRALHQFLAFAREHGLPLREHSPVRYFSKFYGQWGGETHLEQIGSESLARMLMTEIGEGVTELSCHPGYVDRNYSGSYAAERETELRTLCDPAIRQMLAACSIQLVSYHDLKQILGRAAG
jgi:predicted glycoside hydrolase/deacetylase ChbG (UPF0249 family)